MMTSDITHALDDVRRLETERDTLRQTVATLRTALEATQCRCWAVDGRCVRCTALIETATPDMLTLCCRSCGAGLFADHDPDCDACGKRAQDAESWRETNTYQEELDHEEDS